MEKAVIDIDSKIAAKPKRILVVHLTPRFNSFLPKGGHP